ncbi:OmpA family protein [Wandonia haliotis]|uniref:OmpA family protein n=1 Tax=Wandonia haliotis TaxID=574963 RepID=A0ABP3Y622_9FLAO
MKNLNILLAFLFFSFASIAQNVEFDKNLFKDKKDEFKAAVKNLDEGNKLLDYAPFPLYKQALPFFEAANEFNPNNADLNFKIGLCHLNSNMKFKALEYFEKAYKLQPTVNTEIQYYIGRGSQLSQQWDKAIKAYEAFKNTLNTKTDMERIMETSKHIEECRNGKKLMVKPVRVWIDNMGKNINSQYPEYGMIMNADGSEIYFTSRRPNSAGNSSDDFGGYFEDIYMSEEANKEYQAAKNVGEPINTKGHDATVALSPDGSKMLVYIDDKGDGNIYESVRKGSEWSKPKKLNSEICSPYHEPSAWYSPDMRKLYFVSDRPLSGKGAPKDKDIYVASWDAKKEIWTNIERLPETVNTPYDEDGIFMHPDGKTLYFSSKGHSTIGGYDIFYSVRQDDNSWSTPVNIGYPINTPDDDVFFVVAANGKDAYMTSFREDGMGEKDLYKITFLGEEKQPMLNTEDILLAGKGVTMREKVIEPKIEIKRSSLSLLKGIIRDNKTKAPVMAAIEVIDNEKNEIIAEFNSDPVTGKYMVSLPAGKNYGIAVKAEGYLFHSENFDIPKESDYQEYEKNVDLKKVEVGEVIVLRNIFFDLNKYSLRPESQNELDRLTKLLNDNPSIRIQISGHTDSRGSDSYNKDLSHNRAKAVVDYLIDKGISSGRLEYQGYGEEQPIVTDTEIAKLRLPQDKEDAHQSNRRTEFKIISK